MKLQTCVTFILVLLLASTTTQAQFLKSVGIKGGVAVSNVRVTDVHPLAGGGANPYVIEYMDENVVSPTVSLFADFLPGEYFGLQAELTYLRKGTSHTMSIPITTAQYPDGTGEVVEVTTEFSLHYLGFALAAQPRLPLGEAVTLYGYGGPTASYLLAVSNLYWLERFDRFQLGYTLGLGAEVAHLSTGNIFLELRYAGDFTPFYDDTTAKFWNRSWMVSLGTSF